jgi:SAM-dependent methyltransferase
MEKVDWDEYSSRLKDATGTDTEFLHQVAQGAVLDIGCGIGKHLAKLTQATTRMGIDAGFGGLREGTRLFDNVELVCASAYRLPVRSNSFDTVVIIDVIEHLQRPSLALAEIYRVLKPNSQLFLQTPNYPAKRVYDVWHVVRGSRDGVRDDPTHVSKFNCWNLISVVSKAGFEITSVAARNIFLQNYIPLIKGIRGTLIARALGQKIIIVAKKPALVG